MSRNRPSDTFTRFTANSPHASQSVDFQQRAQSKPSLKSSASTSSPDAETAAQKVARLRMQARAQKMGELSTVDKMLVTGRRWADNMHRVTTYSLLGLAGVSAIVASYGIVSLVGHNRRQRRAWMDKELDKLAEAQRAFLRGDANAEQLHLLELERAGDEMDQQRKREAERKKSKSTWTKVKGFMGRGAAAGDLGEETADEAKAREMRHRGVRGNILEEAWVKGEVRPVAVQESGIAGAGLDAKGRPVPINKMERVERKLDQRQTVIDDETPARSRTAPGPLDVMAGNVSDAISHPKSSGGWLSWIRGSSA